MAYLFVLVYLLYLYFSIRSELKRKPREKRILRLLRDSHTQISLEIITQVFESEGDSINTGTVTAILSYFLDKKWVSIHYVEGDKRSHYLPKYTYKLTPLGEEHLNSLENK